MPSLPKVLADFLRGLSAEDAREVLKFFDETPESWDMCIAEICGSHSLADLGVHVPDDRYTAPEIEDEKPEDICLSHLSPEDDDVG